MPESQPNRLHLVSPEPNSPEPDYLTPKEAAEILRTTPGTLEVWRRTGAQDLRFFRRGRNIFYERKDLHQFMRKMKVERSTN
jgi:predicted site-specific integrase-resolvase